MTKIIAFLVVGTIFVALEKSFALRKEQRIFRQGWFTDVTHFMFTNILHHGALYIMTVVAIVVLKLATLFLIPPSLRAATAAQPYWLQFVEAFLILDFSGYISHRLSHQIPALWRFHAVHHSIKEMDWLASSRLHPLDGVFIRPLGFAVLYLLGFSKGTFGFGATLLVLIALFLHSNVRFKLRGLHYIFATPAFHHWHHAEESVAWDKNFAGALPIWDLLFGTFYLPKDQMPQAYGIKDPVPTSYLRQMIYPFKTKKALSVTKVVASS